MPRVASISSKHHSVGGEPLGTDRQQAAKGIKPVGSAIESEGWFTSKDGKIMQGLRGNIRQIGADQIEMPFCGQGIDVWRQQVAL